MTLSGFIRQYQAECLLCGILLLSFVLNFWNAWNQGFSNTYYAAAVRSMLENPVLLFFNSFDPAGFVTVDKPPVGLWVQVASAAIFGYSGWALVLPQALAGTGSVFLIYCIVSRPFGKEAGLIAASALAITPVFVAVSRNGTMDTQMIFVILLALWVALKAARDHSLPLLLCSAVLIGIGFNIKMIQAFVVVPAVLLVYLLGAELPVKKRLVHIVLAIAVLLTVSLSWAVAVDMVPANERPYIGGSGDNTVLGLIVNYNGLHRLENGMGTANGDGTGLWSSGPMTGQEGSFTGMPEAPGGSPGSLPADPGSSGTEMTAPGEGFGPSTGDRQQSGAPGGGGMMGDTGSPGILRLAGEGLAGQLSWLIPFAFIGLLAWWRKPSTMTWDGIKEAGLFSERGLCLLGLLLWLVPGLCYFTFTTGFWHTYYIATIAPPLAGLVGIGAVAMYQAYRDDAGWKGWVLVAAVAATGIFEAIILDYTPAYSGWLALVVATGTVAAIILLAAFRLHHLPESPALPKIVAACAIALLFIAPAAWACTTLEGSGNILPSAGPQNARGGMGAGSGGGLFGGSGQSAAPQGQGMPGSGGSDTALEEFLRSHFVNETWAVAVPQSMTGAQIIIDTGLPVMALGGFAGSDQILTVDGVTSLIHDGKVRYFLTSSSGSGGAGGSANSEIFSWVSSHCTAVPASEWGGTTTTTSTGFSSGTSAGFPQVNGSSFGSQNPAGEYTGTGTDRFSSFTAGNRTRTMPGDNSDPAGMTGSGSFFVPGNRTATASGFTNASLPGTAFGYGMTGSRGGTANSLYDCAGAA